MCCAASASSQCARAKTFSSRHQSTGLSDLSFGSILADEFFDVIFRQSTSRRRSTHFSTYPGTFLKVTF